MEKRTLQKLGLLCASVALCSAASWWSGNNETERQVQKLTQQPIVEQVQEIKVTVCISGAVAKPGLYEVTKGSRAKQVIELAGGVTEEADMDRVNLAQLCKDGGHIKVPRLSKARLKQKATERQTAGEKVAAYGSNENKTSYPESPKAGRKVKSKTGKDGGEKVIVHLNSATEAELVQLPGVGAATARKIVAFRNRRRFQAIEDIMKIPGIGPAKFAKMKALLVL